MPPSFGLWCQEDLCALSWRGNVSYTPPSSASYSHTNNSRCYDIWRSRLGSALTEQLRLSGAIRIVEGDIEKFDVGMSADDLAAIRSEVNFFIHSASSINLRAKLARLMSPIVDASLQIADLALRCPHLDSFVYVSTAYANSNIHDPNVPKRTFIEETIYPLNDSKDTLDSAENELADVRKFSNVPESAAFPFAYGYAKHLTERLLTNLFSSLPVSLVITNNLPKVVF